ncbi:tripartite tricarboxylate transporter substrate binding protein [Cupriavidus sp. CP313]
MRRIVIRFLFSLVSVSAMLAAPLLHAQDYPVKPVTIVVPYPPGGGADILARTLGQSLGSMWGQPVVVDNRAGAGGSIGTAFVAKAPADGYTLLMASPSHAINGSLYKRLPFDALKSFSPVVEVASGPLVLVVSARGPIGSLKDFVQKARAKPGSITFASAGIGSSPHLAGELFNNLAKTKMLHVAYKGTSPALTDVLAGQVEAMFAPLPTAMPYLKSGALKALAVTTSKRFGALPGVPAVSEELPGYEVLQWWGLAAPAGTPAPVIAKIQAGVAKTLHSPEVQERLTAIGAEPNGQPSSAFAKLIASEVEKWAQVVKTANVQPE